MTNEKDYAFYDAKKNFLMKHKNRFQIFIMYFL